MTNSGHEHDVRRLRDRPIAFIVHYVKQRAAAHALVLACVVGAVTCAIASQYAVKNLIDVLALGTSAASAAIVPAYAFLIAFIVADNLLWRVGGWIAARLFVAVTGDVRRDLFAHLSGHAPAYFADRLPGQLAGRISTTANAMFTTESNLAWHVLPPCVAVVAAIAVLASIDPLMAAGISIIAATLAFVLYRLAKHGTPLHRRYAQKAAAVDGELVDVIGNMNVVRMFGATLREQQRLSGKIDYELATRERSLKYLERLRLIHALVTIVLTAVLLGWALLLWREGRATPGDVVLVSSLGFAILHGTRDLAVALVELTQHIARLSEAISTLLIPHALPDAPDAQPLQYRPGRGIPVVCDNVTFAYPGRQPVMNGFNLSIDAGERVGLVGTSGAGKTTVLSLLQRAYDVDGGRILIGGRDIRSLTQDSLREVIAVVPQDVSLFHRTLRENIRYGRPEASDEEVAAAAQAAHCTEFIEAMPEGMNTIVGDRGIRLSGGQRQRIAIARAFLRNAPILLLDEATSALDSESEAAIQDALARLMRHRTVVAIAHRLSTLQRFDRIVVMEQGQVIDQGSPEALAARFGPYRALLDRQLGRVSEAAE
jgi:ATP-binding cassette, subfamily B, bacterial